MHPHSLEAYWKSIKALRGRQRIIMEMFLENPGIIMTDRDILARFEARLGRKLDMNYVRPRITELHKHKQKFLVEVGAARDITGRTVRISGLHCPGLRQAEMDL